MRCGRARAAVGTVALVAPGVVAGLVPWLLTGWSTNDGWPPVAALTFGQALLLGQPEVLI